MGLCLTVSEINGDFSRKSQIFPTPCILRPLELGIGAVSQKNRMMGLPDRTRSLTISSAVWIQNTNVTDRQTDGHRTTAKAALIHSVAISRCKNSTPVSA